MLIIRIKTRDIIRVARKLELKRARLLAISSDTRYYDMLYALDQQGTDEDEG